MNAWLFVTLLCLCPSPVPTPALGDDVIARAGPIEVSQPEFAAWLVERVGYSHAEEYLMERLITLAAQEQGLAPDAAELEAAFQAERTQRINDTFRGDEAAYIEDLVSRGLSPEAHDARRRSQLEPELCLDRMARKMRVFSEDTLRARYKAIFGELGESVSVEALFYSLYHGVGPDSPRGDREAQAERAQELAKKGAAGLRAGQPLADLLPGSDPITNDFVVDGFIDQWRKNLLGVESELALASLDSAGEVSPPVRVWDGYLVLRLVQRELVSFEQAREQLVELMSQEQPDAEELGKARTAVRERYEVEILLR